LSETLGIIALNVVIEEGSMSRSAFCFASLAFAYVLALGCSIAAAEPIAVLVHPTNPIENVSSLEIAKIFRGQRSLWPDGQRIFLVQPGLSNSVRRQFDALVLDPTGGKTGDNDQLTLAASGISPTSFSAISAMIARMPNSIGYTTWSTVEEAKDVKILKVDGFLPEDSGYRLKE
jgi:phosphate transport system substrate-binding protein